MPQISWCAIAVALGTLALRGAFREKLSTVVLSLGQSPFLPGVYCFRILGLNWKLYDPVIDLSHRLDKPCQNDNNPINMIPPRRHGTSWSHGKPLHGLGLTPKKA